jgi:DNA-binding XRE family transcriptional regulator
MARGRRAGSGTEGPHIHFGHVLLNRRMALKDTKGRVVTQTALAKRLGVSQAFIGQLERGHHNLAKYGRDWFEKTAPHFGWTLEEMLSALGLEQGNSQLNHSQVDLVSGQSVAHVERREDLLRFIKVPYFAEGADSVRTDDASGEVWLEDAGFLSKHPNGLFFKLGDPCLEPLLPEHWFAAVVLEPALAYPRSPVLLWLSVGRRVVRYLVRWDERGEHLYYQPNPPIGGRRLEHAPPGSRVLGVVVDVQREVRPDRVLRLSQRELMAALVEERPDLLEDVEL